MTPLDGCLYLYLLALVAMRYCGVKTPVFRVVAMLSILLSAVAAHFTHDPIYVAFCAGLGVLELSAAIIARATR